MVAENYRSKWGITVSAHKQAADQGQLFLLRESSQEERCRGKKEEGLGVEGKLM